MLCITQKGDNLVMPISAPLENLRALRDALHDERTRRSEAVCSIGNMLQQPPVAPQPPTQSPSYSSSKPVQSDIPQDFMQKVIRLLIIITSCFFVNQKSENKFIVASA